MGIFSALIGGAATLGAGLIGSSASKKASKIAERERKDIWRTTLPYRTAGENALKTYLEGLEAGPGEFDPEQEPGYQYGYKQFVENPTLRSASVRGRLFDPSTQLALGRRAQDYASTGYDNFLRRYYQKLQPYANLATQGLQASSRSGQISSNLLPYQQGAAYNQGNALMATVGGLSNIFTNALQSQQTQNILNPGTVAAARQVPNTNFNQLGFGRGGV
jgi:hypothetical protein